MTTTDNTKIESAAATCLYYAARSLEPKAFIANYIVLLRDDPAWSGLEVDEVERWATTSLETHGKEGLKQALGTGAAVEQSSDPPGLRSDPDFKIPPEYLILLQSAVPNPSIPAVAAHP